jgi:hypothetical protein
MVTGCLPRAARSQSGVAGGDTMLESDCFAEVIHKLFSS